MTATLPILSDTSCKKIFPSVKSTSEICVGNASPNACRVFTFFSDQVNKKCY